MYKRQHIIRAMPNTPLMLGVGATAVARAEDVAPELFQTVLELFRAAGAVAVSYTHLDVYKRQM